MEKDKVLIVDDNEDNIEVLIRLVERKGFAFNFAKNGEDAIKMLVDNPSDYNLILLDKMMPGLSGFDVLRKIKENSELSEIPVIIQTADVDNRSIAEGIKLGAYYYLTKPFDDELLYEIMTVAVSAEKKIFQQKNEISLGHLPNTIFESKFVFNDLLQSKDISSFIANLCEDYNVAYFSLNEMMLNAIEHGNLDISYELKGKLVKNGRLMDEIESRLKEYKYKDKKVVCYFEKKNDKIFVSIEDEGSGFDWRKYIKISADRAFDCHGRGIAFSQIKSCNSIEYNEKGNKVNLIFPAKKN